MKILFYGLIFFTFGMWAYSFHIILNKVTIKYKFGIHNFFQYYFNGDFLNKTK